MIYLDDISQIILESLYEADSSDVNAFTDIKIFRAADTGLTYRQIQELEKVGLQKSERSSDKKWRRYALNEITCFLIIAKLKDYGFTFSQLKSVVTFLYETDIELVRGDKKSKMLLIEVISRFSLSNLPLYFICTDTDIVGIFDLPSYDVFTQKLDSNVRESYLLISPTNILHDTLKNLDKRFESKDRSYIYNLANEFSETEKKIVQIIRSGTYESIEVVMKNGKVKYLSLQQTTPYQKNGLTQKDVINLITTKQYGSIRAQVEDGKIVNLVGTEKVKV